MNSERISPFWVNGYQPFSAVIVLDSRWFRKIVNDNNIFVRGFFRFQNKKNEHGEWYKELIFVDSYIRNGYHRDALIEKEKYFTDTVG